MLCTTTTKIAFCLSYDYFRRTGQRPLQLLLTGKQLYQGEISLAFSIEITEVLFILVPSPLPPLPPPPPRIHQGGACLDVA